MVKNVLLREKSIYFLPVLPLGEKNLTKPKKPTSQINQTTEPPKPTKQNPKPQNRKAPHNPKATTNLKHQHKPNKIQS